MLPIGFSTGCFRNFLTPAEAVKMQSDLGFKAIELGFVKIERLKAGGLEEIDLTLLKNFDYVSLHAPKFAYDFSKDSLAILDRFEAFYKKFSLNAIVFHPDEVRDFKVFAEYSFVAAFENMDWQKASYKTPLELGELLTKYPNFKAVIDTNHIFTNNRELDQIAEFKRLCAGRITHLHISGYQKMHELISETQQSELVTKVKDLQVPIICEGELTRDSYISDARAEVSYIRSLLE